MEDQTECEEFGCLFESCSLEDCIDYCDIMTCANCGIEVDGHED